MHLCKRLYFSGRHGKRAFSWTLYLVFLFSIIFFVISCATSPSTNPVTIQKTPTFVKAGGEPVLPHSQILLHDAPLPTVVDMQFDGSTWTLPNFDAASTRSVPLSSCCKTQQSAKLAPRWYHALATPLLDAPVIGNNAIYQLATDGYLHVLSLQTGDEQWRIPVGGEITSGLALAHGLLYLGRDGHFIAALDANTGQERWRFDTVSAVHVAPVVIGHIVLVSSGANSLFCLDALTGKEYWAFHSEDALAQFWPTQTTPAIADGLVYVALGAANEFNALNLRTGRKVWETALHERMTAGPMIDQAYRLVYIVTWSGHVRAFDMHTGKIRWDIQLPQGSESSPALSQRLGLIYLGAYDGYLYALDANTGSIRWRLSVGSAINTSPLVIQSARRTLVVATLQSGTCIIVDASTGQQLSGWNMGELRASPIMAQGILYQASLGDQGLFSFSLQE